MTGRFFLVLISIMQEGETLRIKKKQLEVTKASPRRIGSAYSRRGITPSPRAISSTYLDMDFPGHSFISQITSGLLAVGHRRNYGLKLSAREWVCVWFSVLVFLILLLVFFGKLCFGSGSTHSSHMLSDVDSEVAAAPPTQATIDLSWDLTTVVSSQTASGEASILTHGFLISGPLWKLNSGLEPTASMKELDNWRRRRFVLSRDKHGLRLSYLSEKTGGLDMACFLSRTYVLTELAPVQVNPMANDVRAQAQKSMQNYDLAFERPMFHTYEEYSALLPKTLFPVVIMGKNADSAAVSIVIGAVSDDDRKAWAEIIRNAVFDGLVLAK